jgi:hypothetical protein
MRSWNGWSLSLDSWIVQDGNYPDFAGGQQAEFPLGSTSPSDASSTTRWENARDV